MYLTPCHPLPLPLLPETPPHPPSPTPKVKLLCAYPEDGDSMAMGKDCINVPPLPPMPPPPPPPQEQTQEHPVFISPTRDSFKTASPPPPSFKTASPPPPSFKTASPPPTLVEDRGEESWVEEESLPGYNFGPVFKDKAAEAAYYTAADSPPPSPRESYKTASPPPPRGPCSSPGEDRWATGNHGHCCDATCPEPRDPSVSVHLVSQYDRKQPISASCSHLALTAYVTPSPPSHLFL